MEAAITTHQLSLAVWCWNIQLHNSPTKKLVQEYASAAQRRVCTISKELMTKQLDGLAINGGLTVFADGNQ
jgi:hypothetical protein